MKGCKIWGSGFSAQGWSPSGVGSRSEVEVDVEGDSDLAAASYGELK